MNSNNATVLLALTEREHMTLLNALHLWDSLGKPQFPEFVDDLEGGLIASDEFDDFCTRIAEQTQLDMLVVVESGVVSKAFVRNAAEAVTVNVLDLDVDGLDEDQLTELPLPMIGIQAGELYGVEHVANAEAMLVELNTRLTDGSAPAYTDSQLDLFVQPIDELELAEA